MTPKRQNGLLNKLFGDITELSDEELDFLYSSVAPSEDAATEIQAVTAAAEKEYLRRKRAFSEHVQASQRCQRPPA